MPEQFDAQGSGGWEQFLTARGFLGEFPCNEHDLNADWDLPFSGDALLGRELVY